MQMVIPMGFRVALVGTYLGLLFAQVEPTGDLIGFLLDKGGLTAFAALALFMLRQSYAERLKEQERHREQMAALYQEKEALRSEHQHEMQALYTERDRMYQDFREEMATLHRGVLGALTTNTETFARFSVQIEDCPAVAYDRQRVIKE